MILSDIGMLLSIDLRPPPVSLLVPLDAAAVWYDSNGIFNSSTR